MPPSVTAVIVSYSDPVATGEAIASLRAQTHPPDRILVVDNNEQRLFGDGPGGEVEVLRLPEGNAGYTRASNAAAERADGDWLLFINPDAVAEPDALEHLLAAGEPDDVAIVGAQVLLPDGRTVNAGDNPVHISGLSWSGRFGGSREDGPARDVGAVSGACLLARRRDYLELGGMCAPFFLYVDDTDLCWRARIAGRRVVYCPAAHVRHDYDFDQGIRKWFWLERNRAWAVLANYSGRTIAVLAPVLLAAELGVWVMALRGGWWRQKLAAWSDLVQRRGELSAWRARVQASRQVHDREIVRAHTAALDSPFMAVPGVGLVNATFAAYLRIAGRAL